MLSVDMKDDRSEIVHYNFEKFPIYMRKALLSSYENFEAPPHWHDDIEFISVFRGEMNYNINGETVTVKQGDGIFVIQISCTAAFQKPKASANLFAS